MSDPTVLASLDATDNAELVPITFRAEGAPLAITHGTLLFIPIGSYLLMMQQTYWKSIGLNIPDTDPSIQKVQPPEAHQIFRFLRATYLANAMLGSKAWQRYLIDALIQHFNDDRWKKDLNSADVLARDGLESALTTALLGLPNLDDYKEWGPDAVDGLLGAVGALGGGGRSSVVPVYNSVTGEFSAFTDKDVDRLLSSAQVWAEDRGSGVDFSPSDSSDQEAAQAQYDQARLTKDDAEISEGQTILAFGAVIAAVGGFTPVGAYGVWVMAVGSYQALAASNDKAKLGQEMMDRAVKHGAKGSSIPSESDGSLNEKTIGFKMPKPTLADILHNYELNKSGYGIDGDLAQSDRSYFKLKWMVDRAKSTLSLALLLNPKQHFSGNEPDDTGLNARDWLKHYLEATIVVPKNAADGSQLLDQLGKRPEMPPKAVAFASDFVELSSGVQSVTVSMPVAAV